MSEAEAPAGRLRPPDDSTAPAKFGKRITSTPSRSAPTKSKFRIVSFFALRLGKLLSGIKLPSRKNQQQQCQQPPHGAASAASSTPTGPTVNFNTPSYGRFSEKLTAALSSKTNSVSSAMRGGSDSELPVFQKVSSLQGGDIPQETRSSMWSPSPVLGAFSLGNLGMSHQPQQASAGDTPPQSLNRYRTSPSTTTATATSAAGGQCGDGAAAEVTEATATACARSFPAACNGHAPSHGQSGGAAFLFSCLSGDHSADCDRSATLFQQQQHHHHHQQQRLNIQQQQKQHHQQQISQPQKAHNSRLMLAEAEEAAAEPSASVAASFGPSSSSSVAAMAPRTARCKARWDPSASAGSIPFARSSVSDGVLRLGGGELVSPAPLQRLTRQPSQELLLSVNCQQQQHPIPEVFRQMVRQNVPLVQQPSQEACVTICSPGTTPRIGSPISPRLSHASVRQLRRPQVYDASTNAATTRKLAYQPPEVAAAAAAAGARAGAVASAGVEVEGRAHGGMQAVAALRASRVRVLNSSSSCNCVGVGGGGLDREEHAPVRVKRVGPAFEPASVRAADAAEPRLVTAAAAAAATASAMPALIPSELTIRGQPESIFMIPFKQMEGCRGDGCGIGIGGIGTAASSYRAHGTCSTTTAVGPSSGGSTSTRPSDSVSRSQATSGASPPSAALIGANGSSSSFGGGNGVPRAVNGDGGNASAATKASAAAAASASCDVVCAGRGEASAAGGLPAPSQVMALNPEMPPAMRRTAWTLEDYTVVRRLYKASTSAVYKAVCKRSGLPVALKVYFLNRVPAAVLHMVCREIEIHSAVAHPNIVMLYAAFQTGSHLALVLEYASRGDLYGIQQGYLNRRMDELQVAEVVMRPLLDAVSYLHSHGYCHRDIKPENVLFTSDWRLKLADFGVSIDLNKERAVTRAGTVCYMAPEVARCPLKARPDDNKHDTDLAYGTACDVWALGVLSYELIVGFTPLNPPALPLGGGSGSGAVARPALIFPSGISEAARDFVARALADQPGDRLSSRQMCRHPWIEMRRATAAAGASAAAAGAEAAATAMTAPATMASPIAPAPYGTRVRA